MFLPALAQMLQGLQPPPQAAGANAASPIMPSVPNFAGQAATGPTNLAQYISASQGAPPISGAGAPPQSTAMATDPFAAQTQAAAAGAPQSPGGIMGTGSVAGPGTGAPAPTVSGNPTNTTLQAILAGLGGLFQNANSQPQSIMHSGSGGGYSV